MEGYLTQVCRLRSKVKVTRSKNVHCNIRSIDLAFQRRNSVIQLVGIQSGVFPKRTWLLLNYNYTNELVSKCLKAVNVPGISENIWLYQIISENIWL